MDIFSFNGQAEDVVPKTEKVKDIRKKFDFVPMTYRRPEKGQVYIPSIPYYTHPVTSQHQRWESPSEYYQQTLPESPYGGDSLYWTEMVSWEDTPVQMGTRIPDLEVQARVEDLRAASEIHRLLPMVTLPEGNEVREIFTPYGKVTTPYPSLGVVRPLREIESPTIPQEAYGIGGLQDEAWGQRYETWTESLPTAPGMFPEIDEVANQLGQIVKTYAVSLSGLGSYEDILKIVCEAMESVIPEIAENIARKIEARYGMK